MSLFQGQKVKGQVMRRRRVQGKNAPKVTNDLQFACWRSSRQLTRILQINVSIPNLVVDRTDRDNSTCENLRSYNKGVRSQPAFWLATPGVVNVVKWSSNWRTFTDKYILAN